MECDCIKQLQQELRKEFNDSEEVLDLLNTAAGKALDMNPDIKKAADRELLKEAKRNYERTLSAER